MPALSISAFLRALLSRLFRTGIPPRALKRVLRLSRALFSWLFKTLSGWKGRDDKPSFLPQDSQIARSETSKTQEDLTPKMPQPSLAHEPTSYAIVPDGHTISLEGISASILPFGNGDIRRIGSRTSLRSADIALRSRPGSCTSSVFNLDLPTMIPDLSGRRPNPHRRYAQYTTQSHSQGDTPERSDSLPNIEVTSFVDDSPTTAGYSVSSIKKCSLEVETHNGSVSEIEMQSRLQVAPSTSSQTHGHPSANEDLSRLQPPVVDIPSRLSSRIERPIIQVTPGETERYDRRTRIKKDNRNIIITPMQLEYSEPRLPKGWTRYAHPEGARYFYHSEWKLYTDAEIYDPDILDHLTGDLVILEDGIEALRPARFPSSGEIVVNVYREGDHLKSECYCVDHDKQLVFFVKKFQARDLRAWEEVPGTMSQNHLKYEIMAQYWYFVQLYPHSLAVTKDMLHELRGIILHAIGDCMTSVYPASAYNQDDLNKILSMISELEKNLGSPCAGSTSFFARQMYAFYHARFLNVHGESYARIERNFSIYDDPLYRRKWLIKTLSLPLFSAPEVHLKTLQDMWADGILHRAVWEECMKKMNDEWEQFVFFGTVVLNANVAFLTIQTVDVNNHPYRSPAQIASYVSTVTIVTSIIIGLLLTRQNRTKNRKSAHDVQTFLLNRNHPTLGLETLAILYSLPYAFLMWSMVSFLFAFCFMCFDNSNRSTRIAVGLVCCVMAILVVWCIYSFWETKQEQQKEYRPLAYEAAQQEYTRDDASVVSSQQSREPRIRNSNRIRKLVSPIFDHMRLPWESAQSDASDVHGEV